MWRAEGGHDANGSWNPEEQGVAGGTGSQQSLVAESCLWLRIFNTIPAAEVPGSGRRMVLVLIHHRCVSPAPRVPSHHKKNTALQKET